MVVQHTIATVLCAAVAPILEGLGTLAVCDIGEIRHPAVASEDTLTQQWQVKFVIMIAQDLVIATVAASLL